MSQRDITLHQAVKNLRMFFNTIQYRTSHFHRDIEIMWIMEGNLEVQVGSEILTVHEGEMILLNSEQPHEIKAIEESCTLIGIQIFPDLVAEEVPEFLFVRFDQCFINLIPEHIYHGVEAMILEVMWKYLMKPDYYELYCKSQMQLFVYTLLKYLPHHALTEEQTQIQEQQNARVKRLIRFVDQNYMNNIRLSDFAEKEGRTLGRISHFIQDTMNTTFREYVNLVRYNAACKMMATGQYKMLDICMACGFSDYRYFSKAFVSRTGLTPEIYGRQLINKVDDQTAFKHSLHSRERFYTPEESIELMKHFRERYVSDYENNSTKSF